MENKKYHYVWCVYTDNPLWGMGRDGMLVSIHQFKWQADYTIYRNTCEYGPCVIRRKRQYWESKL